MGKYFVGILYSIVRFTVACLFPLSTAIVICKLLELCKVEIELSAKIAFVTAIVLSVISFIYILKNMRAEKG